MHSCDGRTDKALLVSYWSWVDRVHDFGTHAYCHLSLPTLQVGDSPLEYASSGLAGGWTISETLVAVRKFTKHQLVLLISGPPGTLIIMLTALEVIPVTYLILFVTSFAMSSATEACFRLCPKESKHRKNSHN